MASQSFLDSMTPPAVAASGSASHSTPPPPPLSGDIDLVSGRVMLPGDAAVAAPAPTAGSRALWIVGGVVLLLVLLAIGFLAGQGGGEADIPLPLDPQIEARRQAEPLVDKGRDSLTAGDPSLALDFFDQALALAPGDKEIRSLRDDASRRILQSDTALEDKAIEERIGRIETAIALKEWDRAVSEAEELLAIEPSNEQAKRLLDEATTRRRAARNARDRLQGRRPAQSTPPPPAPVAAQPAKVQKGTLDIEFQSDISKGVLTVFQAGQPLFKQDFEFLEEKGKGIFKRTRPSSGSLSHTVEIDATEQLKLHVYAYRNGETVNREISGNMAAGGKRTLRIRMGQDGVLVVRLE
jgi:tetratricopeptide (TPR) repeat protein